MAMGLLFLAGSIMFCLDPSPLYAEDTSSIPPLPIVYQGIVTVDGERPEGEHSLTVRIENWESNPVLVSDGEFINLIAGPPSVEYVGKVISFHLGEVQADETDVFTLLGVPEFASVLLNFSVRGNGDKLEEGDGSEIDQGDGGGNSSRDEVTKEPDSTNNLTDSNPTPTAETLPASAGGGIPESTLDKSEDERFAERNWVNVYVIGVLILVVGGLGLGLIRGARKRSQRLN